MPRAAQTKTAHTTDRKRPAPDRADLAQLLDTDIENLSKRSSRLQKLVFARLLNLCPHIEVIEKPSLERALAAPDPATFLVRLADELVSPDDTPHPHQDAGIRRGIELRNQILRPDGGTGTAKEAAALLGLKTPNAIYNQIRTRRLLAVPVGNRQTRLPAWQFEKGQVLPGLHEALEALPDGDPWWNLLFFVGHAPYLGGRRPLDVLKKGDVGAVVEAAHAHGQGGR